MGKEKKRSTYVIDFNKVIHNGVDNYLYTKICIQDKVKGYHKFYSGIHHHNKLYLTPFHCNYIGILHIPSSTFTMISTYSETAKQYHFIGCTLVNNVIYYAPSLIA